LSKLYILVPLALLFSTPALADDDPGCGSAVWSPEHGHYHCVGGPEVVRYYDAPPVVAAPRVSVNLAYGYPYYGPRFYARPAFFYGAPYYRGHYWHHHHHGRWW
jgi:hypothetical protein